MILNNASRIIKQAMKGAGKLQAGDDPNSEDYAEYLPTLNDYCNFLQTQGMKLWLQTDLAVPLVAGQAKYHISPTGDIAMTKPLRVVMGYYMDSNLNQRPLIPISWDEYTRLSRVVQQGALNSYFVDKQALSLDVSFWLTPDIFAATGTAHLVISQQVGQVVSITDTMNFPIEWTLTLIWGLASQLCTGQPASVQKRCDTFAEFFRLKLEDWDVEDASTQFSPDPRMVYTIGAFR